MTPSGLATEHQHARTVPCPRTRCAAPIGEPCVNETHGSVLTGLPHLERTAFADQRAAEAHACPDCTAEPQTVCRDNDGRALDPKRPCHDGRLQLAGRYSPPLQRHELSGFPHKLDAATQRARGKAEVNRRRVELEQRRRELLWESKGGDLDERGRAELLDLDATLGLATEPEPEPIPDQRDAPAEYEPWMRGPR